jgi:hypothetical protein
MAADEHGWKGFAGDFGRIVIHPCLRLSLRAVQVVQAMQ